MNTIVRKAPIRAKHYLKKSSLDALPSNVGFGIEEVQDIHLTPVSNASLTTLDGFFGEQQDNSLLYQLCAALAPKFLETVQYLWGNASSASITKTIQEILEEFENIVDNQETVTNFEEKKTILQQVNQALYFELENRETIQHKMLLGNLMTMTD
jgi:hypothetical protein